MFFFGWQEGFLQILQIPPPFSSSKPPLKTISHSQNGFIFPHFSGMKKPPTRRPGHVLPTNSPRHCQIERTDLRWPGAIRKKGALEIRGRFTYPFLPPQKKGGSQQQFPPYQTKNGKWIHIVSWIDDFWKRPILKRSIVSLHGASKILAFGPSMVPTAKF